MELYKVLLVDDEANARESIVRVIDWEKLGFEMVGQASNGEEALDLAERLQPDVLMTDIKMPFMDGLELCCRIKRLLPSIRLAIFSGFDEFEYAKEAITQQVEEYILKPIDTQELMLVFQRMRTNMDAEIAERRDIQRLRQYYEQSLPLLQQQMLIELLENRVDSRDVSKLLIGYELDIAAASYCVAALQHRYADDLSPEEGRLFEVSLCQLIRDTLGNDLRYHLIQRLDRIVLLFLLDGQTTTWVIELLNPLFAICRKLLNIRISIGVGHSCTRTDNIALSYEQACNALEYWMVAEQGQCVFIGDMEPGASCSILPDAGYAEELLRQIRAGTEQELNEAVKRLIDHLKHIHTGVQQIRIYLLELQADLLKLIRTYCITDGKAIQDTLLQQGLTMPFSDMDEFEQWLLQYCNKLRQMARRERKYTVRLLVDRLNALLQEQYMDYELSLESACDQLGVSTAYMSTLFKKETGQGFVNYLTDLRMDKALELLTASDKKTYQIAEAVGYSDANYFSYVFKRKFGVAPTKYRSDRMKANETAEASI